jgi:hypothetical protein
LNTRRQGLGEEETDKCEERPNDIEKLEQKAILGLTSVTQVTNEVEGVS